MEDNDIIELNTDIKNINDLLKNDGSIASIESIEEYLFKAVKCYPMSQKLKLLIIIKESLLLIGWVALWEPVSFILFGWRIINRDKQYYIKLCNIPIEVIEKRFITQIFLHK